MKRGQSLQEGSSNLLQYSRRTSSFGSQLKVVVHDMLVTFLCELVQDAVYQNSATRIL